MSQDKHEQLREAISGVGRFIGLQINSLLTLAEQVYEAESAAREADEVVYDRYEVVKAWLSSDEDVQLRNELSEKAEEHIPKLPPRLRNYCLFAQRMFDSLCKYVYDENHDTEELAKRFSDTSFLYDYEALKVILDTGGKWLFHEMAQEIEPEIVNNPLRSGDYISVRGAIRQLSTLRERLRQDGFAEPPACLGFPLQAAEYIVAALRKVYKKNIPDIASVEADESIFADKSKTTSQADSQEKLANPLDGFDGLFD